MFVPCSAPGGTVCNSAITTAGDGFLRHAREHPSTKSYFRKRSCSRWTTLGKPWTIVSQLSFNYFSDPGNCIKLVVKSFLHAYYITLEWLLHHRWGVGINSSDIPRSAHWPSCACVYKSWIYLSANVSTYFPSEDAILLWLVTAYILYIIPIFVLRPLCYLHFIANCSVYFTRCSFLNHLSRRALHVLIYHLIMRITDFIVNQVFPFDIFFFCFVYLYLNVKKNKNESE